MTHRLPPPATLPSRLPSPPGPPGEGPGVRERAPAVPPPPLAPRPAPPTPPRSAGAADESGRCTERSASGRPSTRRVAAAANAHWNVSGEALREAAELADGCRHRRLRRRGRARCRRLRDRGRHGGRARTRAAAVPGGRHGVAARGPRARHVLALRDAQGARAARDDPYLAGGADELAAYVAPSSRRARKRGRGVSRSNAKSPPLRRRPTMPSLTTVRSSAARNEPLEVALRATLVDADHHDVLVPPRDRGRARVSVSIATANVKEMRVEAPVGTAARARGHYVSILGTFDRLAKQDVELRMLHAGTPSRAFRAELGEAAAAREGRPRDAQCPRVHLKLIAVDGRLSTSAAPELHGRRARREGATAVARLDVGIVTDDERMWTPRRHGSIGSGRAATARGVACARCAPRRSTGSVRRRRPHRREGPETGP